jgi:vacuolar protein sorting-associated protein 8
VTALALSFDHTYVASGHATGYIQLYDLSSPATPARTVVPTTISVVATGRKEGHIQGSRIVSIGFIAGRHTRIVSADEHGLSFFHKLGKVLFVEAPDILRILGKYELGEHAVGGEKRRKKARYSVLSMIPLPLGPQSHPTDTYNVIALLTPTKLVVVGLKPTPRTWIKCVRAHTGRSRDKTKGVLSWYPSVPIEKDGEQSKNEKKVLDDVGTNPLLLYTWGERLHILRLSEHKTKQTPLNSKGVKGAEVEVGEIAYEDGGSWTAESEILAAQWLNVNVRRPATLHD